MAWDHESARAMGIVALVIACGPVAGQPGAEGEDATSGASSGDATGESSRGMTSAGDADATTAADESSTGAADTLLCGASDPGQPLAVLSGETTAAVLHGDGSVTPLDLPDPMAPADALISASFAARGDRIAVVWSWSVIDGGVGYGSHLAVLSAAGELSWTHGEPDAAMSAAAIGDDGSLVFTRNPTGGTGEGVVLFGPDDELVLPEFRPRGPLRADGWIRGDRTTPEGGSLPGWMSTELEWQGLRESPMQTVHASDDEAYVYLSQDGIAVSLVVDTPTESTVVLLPMLAGIGDGGLDVQASPDLAWLLVRDDGGRWWRITVPDGATEELTLVPPNGEIALECYYPAAAIDDAGRVLLATRDASSAAVLRWDPAASSWTAIGDRVTDVDDMEAMPFRETALVKSAGVGETFCPPQTYEPGTAVLAGTTQQLVRPLDGVTRVLPQDSWVIPDATGVCAAVVTADGVTVIDLLQEQEIDVADVQQATWWGR